MEERQDLISRQAAIEALLEKGQCSKRYRLGDIWELNFDEIREAIATVPSAQPTKTDTSNTLKSLDCVERQAAIDAANDWLLDCLKIQKQGRSCGLIRRLEDLPSAQPEQRWIPCSKPPEEDGVYIVYAPDYSGGSSSAKECHDGVMFSKYKNGKWSIEHGYYSRPNCVKAWKPLDEPCRGEGEPK